MNQLTSSANHASNHAPKYWNQIVSIAGRGAGVLMGLSMTVQLPVLAEEVRISQATSNVYPPEEVQAYMDSCLSTAAASGLEDTVAQNYCTCTITAIQDRFTYDQFVGFAQTIQATQQLPNELVEVVQSCTPQ